MTEKLHLAFNRARLDDRQVNELLGLAHGIIADGIVTQEEAEYLQKWLTANTAARENPVVANLLFRINAMLCDNVLDETESAELFETLQRFSGGDFELGELQKSTSLPLDQPVPSISIPQTSFCFTGTFAYGSRKDCKDLIDRLGGSVTTLKKTTDYLVIGVYATDSWAHSSYGRKIEKAVAMKQKGVPIHIIGEVDWLKAIEVQISDG